MISHFRDAAPRLLLIAVTAALAAGIGCSTRGTGDSYTAQGRTARRIVSFAPSITETLFALGLGDRVVGVTRYCLYPPEAQKLPKLGGYTDPNFEMILGLKPDLVLMLKEHGPLMDFLRKNAISYRVIQNEKLDDIIGSFSVIAGLCGVKGRGDSMAARIRSELQPADSRKAAGPTVLFCIGRDSPGSGTITKLFAAGPKSFYCALIGASGARNACTDSLFTYPELSAEGVIRMAPEVIVDIMPSVTRIAPEKAIADWNSMPLLPAVRAHHVFCLSADYATIPGPRIVLVLRDLRRIIKDSRTKSYIK